MLIRVQIIFSEVIHKNLVTSSNSPGVQGSAKYSQIGALRAKPSKILAKMLSKHKKIVNSLTHFGVRYNRIVTLESVFLCKTLPTF